MRKKLLRLAVALVGTALVASPTVARASMPKACPGNYVWIDQNGNVGGACHTVSGTCPNCNINCDNGGGNWTVSVGC